MILTGTQFLQEDNDATLFQSTAMQEVQLRKFTSNPVEKKQRLDTALEYGIFTADTALHGTI